MFFCGVQDFIVIQKIVQALGSEAEFGMGNSFIFRLWNMEFFFIVQWNDEEFFPKIVTSNMEFYFQQFNTETLCDFSNVILLRIFCQMTLGNVEFSCSKIPPQPREIIIHHDPYPDEPFVELLEHSIIHAYSLESSPTWF